MKYRLLAIFVAILLTLGGSCNSVIQPQRLLYFPVQKEMAQTMFLALLTGELVLDNVYLRVNGELIIWPYGYSLVVQGKNISVIDDNGQQWARVGDTVKLGGGEIPASSVEQHIGQALPPDCKGPYWLAATEYRTPTPTPSTQNQQPIQVISVLDTYKTGQTVNPGGGGSK